MIIHGDFQLSQIEQPAKTRGFTLIELVVVLIMLGILSATVIPRFFTNQGFAEVTYRNELVTKLRAIQLRAMQETAGKSCRIVSFTTSNIGLLATKNETTTNECEAILNSDTTSVEITSDHAVTFTFSDVVADFSFNPMGRPVGCNSPCDIKVIGESTLTVRIESEGYIHAL